MSVAATQAPEPSPSRTGPEPKEPQPTGRDGWWSRRSRIALPLAGLLIAALAVLVLERFLHDVSLADVKNALANIPKRDILLAVLLTAVSFAAVSVYDVVAVETVAPGRVSRRLAALVGATAYAISGALGFAVLTGGALRYRVYAGEGIALPDIGRIVGASWGALGFALAVLIAAGLVLDPAGAPLFDRLDPAVDVVLGALMLLAVALFVGWLAGGRRTLRLGRFSVRMPSSRAALLQIAAGVTDIAAAAGVLYVLMPADVGTNPALFVMVYAAAIVVGIASHAPGGLGAFEATIVAGLGLGNNPEALAALLLYRVIYTLLPFLLAVLGVLAFEVGSRREHVGRQAKAVAGFLEPFVPPLAAGLTFLGGVVLMVSGVTPGIGSRLAALGGVLPLPFIEMSHLASSVVAVAMIVVARGLSRRLHRAWAAALLLFALGALFSLLKGLDWEEALTLLALSAILYGFRASFYRRPAAEGFALSAGWLAGLASTVVLAIWIGLLAYRDVPYSGELWWQFAADGDAPRFMRLAAVAAALTLGLGLHTFVNRRAREGDAAKAIPACVPALVADAPDSAAALALLGDKSFLMDGENRGFVMYARSGGSLVALGEPVAPDSSVRDELAWAFRDLADRQAMRTVFYEVGPESLPLFLDMGLVALKLGEVARVDLARFSLEGGRRQNLRYAERKADKDGIVYEVVPAVEIGPLLPELRAVSDAWLAMKQGREKGFSLGFFDEAFLGNFDTAVMRGPDGRVLAFANLWRGGKRHEIAVDLMRHAPDAPRTIMDALFAKLMMGAKAEGYRWFNLGAAPLSGLSPNRLASRWNRFGSFVYRRGQTLYHFDGLKAFKDKFDPVWTPHYLACPPGLGTVRALWDVTALVSGNPLEFIRK